MKNKIKFKLKKNTKKTFLYKYTAIAWIEVVVWSSWKRESCQIFFFFFQISLRFTTRTFMLDLWFTSLFFWLSEVFVCRLFLVSPLNSLYLFIVELIRAFSCILLFVFSSLLLLIFFFFQLWWSRVHRNTVAVWKDPTCRRVCDLVPHLEA